MNDSQVFLSKWNGFDDFQKLNQLNLCPSSDTTTKHIDHDVVKWTIYTCGLIIICIELYLNQGLFYRLLIIT